MGNYNQENGRLQESQEVHVQVYKGQYNSSQLQIKRNPLKTKKSYNIIHKAVKQLLYE